MGFAAEQSGASLESLEKGLFGLSRSIYDLSRESAEAVEAYERIGLSLSDLEGLTVEQQMDKVADALSRIEDESVRGAIAQKIFGRAGRELLPLLSEGSAGMADLRKEAAELGRVLTNEDADAAAKLTDAMNRVKSTISGVVTQVGAALAPVMTQIADLISAASSGFVAFIKDNRELAQAAAVAGAALTLTGGIIAGTGLAMKVAASSIGLMSAAFTTAAAVGKLAAGVFSIVQAV